MIKFMKKQFLFIIQSHTTNMRVAKKQRCENMIKNRDETKQANKI